MPYISSIERMGIEKGTVKGMEKGIKVGKTKLLLRQLKLKFKIVPIKYLNLIEKTDDKTLLIWCDRVLKAKKITEVFKK